MENVGPFAIFLWRKQLYDDVTVTTFLLSAIARRYCEYTLRAIVCDNNDPRPVVFDNVSRTFARAIGNLRFPKKQIDRIRMANI